MIAFTSKSLLTPTATITNPVMIVEQGTVIRIESRDRLELPHSVNPKDFDDCIIAPGFIDIHVHGSAGYDAMQADQTTRGDFEKFLARHGVTAYCPTTVAAPIDTTQAALERLADAIEAEPGQGHAGGQTRAGAEEETPPCESRRRMGKRGIHHGCPFARRQGYNDLNCDCKPAAGKVQVATAEVLAALVVDGAGQLR